MNLRAGLDCGFLEPSRVYLEVLRKILEVFDKTTQDIQSLIQVEAY